MNGDESGSRPQPRRPGRRRRLAGGRHRVLKVRVCEQELAAIRREAARLGVSAQRLLVECALTGRVRTASERHAGQAELMAVRRLTAALGNNVNQLARVANVTGHLPTETAVALDAVTRVMRRLHAVLEDEVSQP